MHTLSMSKETPKGSLTKSMDSSPFFFSFFFFLLFKVSMAASTPNITNLFPSILIFGDSTADPGNNNYITTSFKANHHPYGLNFPGQVATGRFSNGKLVADFWASLLGIKETIPPFLQPNISDFDIRTGVNFASAGSGFDDLTAQVSQVISMTKQLHYFREYKWRLKKLVGPKEAKRLIGGALVSISAGTNDFTISYYDLSTRRNDFSIADYQDYVLKKLQNFVNELYKLGCRTMMVTGLPPMGCVPIQMAASFSRRCIKYQNADARIYNRKLKSLLSQIQSSLPGSRVLYADIYTPTVELLRHPKKHGFRETKVGCCGIGYYEAGLICTPLTPLCEDPSSHVFFDSIHPTEAAYRYVTKSLLNQLFLNHSLIPN